MYVAMAINGVSVNSTKTIRSSSSSDQPSAESGNEILPSSPYTKFQGLGFEIYTGSAPAFLDTKKRKKNPECISQYSYGVADGELQCYIGHQNPVNDLQRRLEIMSTAVDRAYELSDKDNTTLKVFVAPEFFWRGKEGAYIFDSETKGCGYICQILHGLENIVQRQKFKDWLFVFGTIVASESLPSNDEYDYLFYNFAPVYKGFDPDDTTHVGKRFLVPKRYVSHIDFLTPRRFFSHGLAKQLIDEGEASDDTLFNPYDFDQKKYDNEGWNEYKGDLANLGYTMIEYGWFLMDGITITLEICLDHDRHSALDSYMADVVTGSKTMIPSGGKDGMTLTSIPVHQAQISLVSSAGMTVNAKSLVLAHKGTILLQDGLNNGDSTWEHHGQQGILFDGGSEAVRRYAILSPTDVFFEYKLNTAYKKHHIYENDHEWMKALNKTFSTMMYEPKITVYEPVDISKVESGNNML